MSEVRFKSKDRKADVVLARQMYYYICFKHSRDSLVRIGKLINRNHATVIHANKMIENYMELYPNLNSEYESIMDILKRPSIIVSDIDLLHICEINKQFLNSTIGV